MKRLLSIYICLLSSLCMYAQGAAGGAHDGKADIVSAVALYDEGKLKEAEEMLVDILAEDSENDAGWYYLAMCSLEQNNAERAETCLKKAVELDPDNFWYSYRLAGLYAVTSRPELTTSIYERLLKDFPSKSELYYKLVELYASQGEKEKALQMLEQIETVFGMTESLAIYRFNLLRMLGRQEDAYGSLEEYNREYSSPYVLSALGDWQMSMYNDSTALSYYDEAIDLAPDFSPALLGKAETLRLTRRYDEYFDVLEDFVSDSDSGPAAKADYLMAVVSRTDPKFLKSFTSRMDSVISKALDRHPSDSNMLRLAGLYHYSTDRKPEAGKYFHDNAYAFPESITASADLVEFLMYSEDWENLSSEGRKAFERFPQETAFLEMASVGDFNMQDYQKVLEICNTVLDVAPADSSATLRAWSTMGDIYFKTGEEKKAFKAYDKALKINPDYIYVLNNYAYYLSVVGKNLKKAYAMSRKTIDAEPDNATYLDTFGWILFLQGKPQEAKPYFKRAMLYGGKESAVVMDHYAEVLWALKEYDMAFVYWNLALQKNDGDSALLEEKVRERRQEYEQNRSQQ